MGDVIAGYHRPPDPAGPTVCVGEGGTPRLEDIRESRPVRLGSPAAEDSAHERHGTANLFLASGPLGERQVVELIERRTAPGS